MRRPLSHLGRLNSSTGFHSILRMTDSETIGEGFHDTANLWVGIDTSPFRLIQLTIRLVRGSSDAQICFLEIHIWRLEYSSLANAEGSLWISI